MVAVQFVDIIATTFRETGRLELPEGSREQIIQLLEMLIADEDALLAYSAIELLPRLKEASVDFRCDSQMEQEILNRRWQSLADEAIAALLLMPAELDRLGSCIDEELPLPWVSVIDEVDRRALDRVMPRSNQS